MGDLIDGRYTRFSVVIGTRRGNIVEANGLVTRFAEMLRYFQISYYEAPNKVSRREPNSTLGDIPKEREEECA